MQEGGTVDPVSGNEVPPGAMAEEVRDDIDAKLSEGEFVFPADVVRYWGLEKLMMMRDKAKIGLQKMNDIGQMGNASEVPDGEALHGGGDEMDDEMFSSEIDSIMNEDSGGERGYAAGGYIAPKNQADNAPSVDQKVYNLPDQSTQYANAPIKGFQMVAMTNSSGQTIYIPFINGVPQLNVPTGYKVASTTAAEPTAPTATTAPAANTEPGGDSVGFDGGPGGGGNTDGSSKGGGQGISNSAISAGLAAMSFGQSTLGKGISAILGVPASTAANVVGPAVVDDQLGKLGAAVDALSNANTQGGQVATVSDKSGNISTVSNQSLTDDFDLANFGITSAGLSAASAQTAATEASVSGSAQADADAAAGAAASEGYGVADSVGADGLGVGDIGGGSSDGSDGGYWAKGGFVSKKKPKAKSKGLAGRRN